MKPIELTFGVTINTGNFESVKLSIAYELEPGDTVDSAKDAAEKEIATQLKRLPMELQNRLNDALSRLNDAEVRAEMLERANQGAMLQFNGIHEDITAKKAEFKRLLSQIALGNAELEALKAEIRELREDSESLIQLGILVRDDAPKQIQGQADSPSSKENNWDRYQEGYNHYEELQGDNLP